MNRVNLWLTLIVGILFILLMQFAGQPITPEAALVDQWYQAFCNPTVDQSLLYTLTWRGNLSDSQLQTTVDAYRAANGFAQGCTPVENHNIIYFQSIPAELSDSIERIKFVAVNVYAPDQPHTPNHVLSVQYGLHVLFYKNGVVKILPQFIPDTPLGLHHGLTPLLLYNNDGLLMGQVQLTGQLIRIPQSDVVRYGIPLQFSTLHTWGRGWFHIYADGLQVQPERFADILPPDQQATFLPPFIEDIPANTLRQGVVWFSLPTNAPPPDVRITLDAYQTVWDLRGLAYMIAVTSFTDR